MKKENVLIPFEWFPVFMSCDNATLCKYLKAIQDYIQNNRKEPNFHGGDKYLWLVWKQRLE